MMPVQNKLEEWKKVASALDKDHAKGEPIQMQKFCCCIQFGLSLSVSPFRISNVVAVGSVLGVAFRKEQGRATEQGGKGKNLRQSFLPCTLCRKLAKKLPWVELFSVNE